MFSGNVGFQGAMFLSNATFLLLFFTLILVTAQEDEFSILILDIIQTFVSWPNYIIAAINTTCLWCFRNIERILGSKTFLILELYNLISFSVIFLLIIALKGFKSHFSFFYFIPYSLYVYTFWEIPSVKIYNIVSDKIIVTIAFIILAFANFPYFMLSLIPAIVGNIMYQYDVFHIIKYSSNRSNNNGELPLSQENPDDIHLTGLLPPTTSENDTQAIVDAQDDTGVQILIDMGFAESDARQALQNADGDIQRAADYLLNAI